MPTSGKCMAAPDPLPVTPREIPSEEQMDTDRQGFPILGKKSESLRERPGSQHDDDGRVLEQLSKGIDHITTLPPVCIRMVSVPGVLKDSLKLLNGPTNSKPTAQSGPISCNLPIHRTLPGLGNPLPLPNQITFSPINTGGQSQVSRDILHTKGFGFPRSYWLFPWARLSGPGLSKNKRPFRNSALSLLCARWANHLSKIGLRKREVPLLYRHNNPARSAAPGADRLSLASSPGTPARGYTLVNPCAFWCFRIEEPPAHCDVPNSADRQHNPAPINPFQPDSLEKKRNIPPSQNNVQELCLSPIAAHDKGRLVSILNCLCA
ncbi:hypothetical protein AAG570_000995 [Ranatra chinensis]|uniref:Uncharacterized protein n=1 Tax=Ranatra chinensis TaxID=642074 RepID=A0ABD0YAK1_9HEMI